MTCFDIKINNLYKNVLVHALSFQCLSKHIICSPLLLVWFLLDFFIHNFACFKFFYSIGNVLHMSFNMFARYGMFFISN
jgi:hypothetical protein